MGNGLYHENEGVATLQREVNSIEESLKLWNDSDKKNYSEAFKRQCKKLEECKKCLEILLTYF